MQYALDEFDVDTIIIDNVGSEWISGPLIVDKNDITILFEEGVVLKALPNAFDIFEPMLRIVDKNNINIIGYGATIQMNKAEYVALADSEFRHGILLSLSLIHI